MSNTTQAAIPAEQLVIISNRIRVWSGTIKITRESDLAAINGQLPPKTVVSDGRKTLVESKHLAGLESVRKSIERFLKAEGFSYVGCGVAVTGEMAQRFLQELPKFEQQFTDALDDLCRNLDTHYQEMETKAGTWSSILSQSRLTAKQIRDRCHFGMNIFRMASPDNDPNSPAASQYRDTMAEALPSLLESVAKDASKLLSACKGKSRMLQTQLVATRRLVDKLKAFAFLDPRVGPATSGMQAVLSQMPASGVLNEVNASMCVAVIDQLTRPQNIIEHGTGVIADTSSMPSSQTMISDQSELSLAVPTVTPRPASTTKPAAKPVVSGLAMAM